MSWKEFTIGDLCSKVTDGSHFSPREIEVGYPMFSVKDMDENGFDYSEVKRISKEDFLKLAKGDCKPMKDDVLIAKDGSYLKHVFVCKEEKDEAILSSIAILRPDKKKIDPDFFKHLLRSPSVKGMMESFVSGSALPRIVLKDFKKMKLSIPDLTRQQQIAVILNSYDDLLAVNNQRIKLLDDTAKEFYREWFVRMRFPGHKKVKFLKGVPEKFGEIKYFKDFVKLNRGFDLPEEKIVEGKYPVVASTTIKAFHNQFKVKAPLITTGRSGSLGTVLYVNEDGWPLNTSLYIKDFKDNEPLYVLFTLKTIDFESFNSGAGVPTLNQNHLHKLKIWIACDELQAMFIKMVEPMFQQIEILKKENNQLRQIKDRLLPRLISGKLNVKTEIQIRQREIVS